MQDIARGFDLSGPIPGCREFKPKLTLASMPVRELHRAAPLMREITMANTGSSGDAVLDEALYEATMKEVSKGWLAGPLDTTSLGPTSVVSRRFGIWQGDKCRPIDDFKASCVNATASSVDSVAFHSADTVAAVFYATEYTTTLNAAIMVECTPVRGICARLTKTCL